MQVTGLRSGTLYPMLMRLYERGWLERRWETAEESGGVPRHLYRATAEGDRGMGGALAAAHHRAPVVRPLAPGPAQ